ncbi:MAG: hypothetical protein HKP34_07070 [Nitrosopumilus sp.]|nr:hypothetical protein [Nitrosopumilus sp.]NNL38047.1 hypothetical protein [Nitrosopumilus sp.]
MAKDKKKKEEDKPKKNDFKSFLKKRAPIYLALIAMLIVFVIPEMTKGDLQSCLPELSVEEQEVVDVLMRYNGPDNDGFTMMDAISKVLSDEYPDEKIFDNKKTSCNLTVSNIESSKYQIIFNFESHRGQINFDWNVDTDSEMITANDPKSKGIIHLVDFYD